MRENDGRMLDHATLEVLRLRAVDHVEAGAHPEDVAETLGMHRKTVYGWLAKARQGGRDALLAKAIPGRPPKLSGRQMRRVYELVVGSDPRQLKFEFALWTRGMVRELIRREFGVGLSGGCSRRWGSRRRSRCTGPGRPTPTRSRRGSRPSTPRSRPRPRRPGPPSTLPTRHQCAATTTRAPPGRRSARPRWWQPPGSCRPAPRWCPRGSRCALMPRRQSRRWPRPSWPRPRSWGTRSASTPRPRRGRPARPGTTAVSYTHLRAHETDSYLVCRL